MARSPRLLTLALALTLLLALAAPAHAFAGRNGSVVYGWSSADEPELGPPFTYEYGIRAVTPRGGTPTTVRGCRQVTGQPDAGDCAIHYANPAIAPKGRRIAFDAGDSLALMGGDGSGLRLLPAHSADDGEPAFAPSGTRLVFSAGPSASGNDRARRGIWVSDLADRHARRLAAIGTDPAWSARNLIAFVRRGDIWGVRPDGRGLRRLARDGAGAPAFSPHGTKLAFARHGWLVVLDLATHHTHRVWQAGATDLAWSPDGTRFVVHVFDGGVWTVGANGRGARQLVPGGIGGTYAFDANGVDWQPLR